MLYQLSYRPLEWEDRTAKSLHQFTRRGAGYKVFRRNADRFDMAESMERRTQPRIAWRGNLQLVLTGGTPIPVSIRDISTSGFGLWSDLSVAPGEHVEVHGEGFTGSGTVQYCEPQGARFRIGLALHSAMVS